MISNLSHAASATARGPRADVVRVVDAIRAIIQSLRISGRAVEQQLGISSAQLYILQELAERPAQSINDLAYNTFTHQSSVSMVVSRLVDHDLVRAGNEAVLRARYEDAAFFYRADREVPLAELRSRLSRLTFTDTFTVSTGE